jgi:hypothetical protein
MGCESFFVAAFIRRRAGRKTLAAKHEIYGLAA